MDCGSYTLKIATLLVKNIAYGAGGGNQQNRLCKIFFCFYFEYGMVHYDNIIISASSDHL